MATSDLQSGEISLALDKEETTPTDEEDEKCKEKTKRTAEWVIQVKQRFKSKIYKTRESSKDVCIFKVPRAIRDVKPQAYDPCVVSFGPFFHNEDKKELHVTDDHKLSAVEAILPRLKVPNIESLIEKIISVMEQIRDCYQDRAAECNEQTLAWMMTMDACFIIQFFNYDRENHFSLIFEKQQRGNILNDIFKLESQIPMLVLKLILELDTDENAVSMFASRLCRWWVFCGYPFSNKQQSKADRVKGVEQYIRNGNASHMLDLYRMVTTDFLLPSDSNSVSLSSPAQREPWFFTVCAKITNRLTCLFRFTNSADNEEIDFDNYFPSAASLRMAGIVFDQSVDGKIRFEKHGLGSAIFFIPQITYEDATETWLRNLIALEECRRSVHEEETRIISYYAFFLDRLIDSKEDVALLRKGNVLKTAGGNDEEIAEMFNNIGKGATSVSYGPYKEVLKSVKEHYNNKWHHWIAGIKELYFSKPWLTASLLAAMLILVMTAVQTAYSVKAVQRSH